MKKIMLFALLVLGSLTTFAQKTNFSGNWMLDTAKTDFNDGPKWTIPYGVTIKQDNDQLTLVRVNVNEKLERQEPISEKLVANNMPANRITSKGDTITTTVKWANTSTLVIMRKSAAGLTTDTCTLEDGGKTLVIDRSVNQSNGFDYTIEGYYKQQ